MHREKERLCTGPLHSQVAAQPGTADNPKVNRCPADGQVTLQRRGKISVPLSTLQVFRAGNLVRKSG